MGTQSDNKLSTAFQSTPGSTSETDEREPKDILTLKELAEELSEKKKKENKLPCNFTPEKADELDEESIFKATINKIISLENLSSISTPMRTRCSGMGCDTPFQNLMKDFSPSVFRYMDKNKESQANKNGYNFVKNMSPRSLSLAMMANSNNNAEQEFDGIFKNHIPIEIKSEKANRDYCYPGSMLAGNTEMNNGFDLESYLSANSNEESPRENYIPPNGSQSYVEEVADDYQPNAWSPVPNNQYQGNGNLLPPVMLSSYEEIALLQQELQSTPGMPQYVLPVFFQPFLLSDKEKGKKALERKCFSNHLKSQNLSRMEDQKADQKVPEKPVMRSFTVPTDCDERLLTKCKIALDPETSEIRPRNTPNGSSMKYLEEAAVRLLQDDFVHQDKRNGNNTPGKYRCEECGRCFNRQYTLNTHRRIHTGEKPYICHICGVGFRQSGTKLNHIRAVHTKERPFECQYCGKTFSHKSSITVHIRIHTNEKPYECESCKRRFTDRATYLKHQAIHSGMKPYRCPVCTKCFSQKSNLKRHFKNIHQNSEPDYYGDSQSSVESLFA